MTDPAARLRRVRELFDGALEVPQELRAAYLAARAGDDPAIAGEVAALLAAHARTAGPLDRPLVETPAEPDRTGERIGPYEIVRLVGMGGMGAVYEAVRADDQFRKRVAIKLVQGPLHSAPTFARFRRERQILADLAHKNIAALLDGATEADLGTPAEYAAHVLDAFARTADPAEGEGDVRRISKLLLAGIQRVLHPVKDEPGAPPAAPAK